MVDLRKAAGAAHADDFDGTIPLDAIRPAPLVVHADHPHRAAELGLGMSQRSQRSLDPAVGRVEKLAEMSDTDLSVVRCPWSVVGTVPRFQRLRSVRGRSWVTRARSCAAAPARPLADGCPSSVVWCPLILITAVNPPEGCRKHPNSCRSRLCPAMFLDRGSGACRSRLCPAMFLDRGSGACRSRLCPAMFLDRGSGDGAPSYNSCRDSADREPVGAGSVRRCF